MDKTVIIRVLHEGETRESGLGSQVMNLLTGDDGEKYVGMVNGRIALTDKSHAVRYRMKADNVEAQIAEVKRLYGAIWVADECVGGGVAHAKSCPGRRGKDCGLGQQGWLSTAIGQGDAGGICETAGTGIRRGKDRRRYIWRKQSIMRHTAHRSYEP